MKILCVYCGDLFAASPRHRNQIACKKPACQRARKAEWQRHKMRTDPEYNTTQKLSQKQWARANPGLLETIPQQTPRKSGAKQDSSGHPKPKGQIKERPCKYGGTPDCKDGRVKNR